MAKGGVFARWFGRPSTDVLGIPGLLEPLREAVGDKAFRELMAPGREFTPIEDPTHEINRRRQAILDEAQALAKANDYSGALDRFLLLVIYDEVGRQTCSVNEDGDLVWRWDPRLSHQSHGVMKAIAKSANYLGLTTDELRARYQPMALEFLDTIKHLDPPCSADDAWVSALPWILEHIETGTRWRPRSAPPS